MTEAHFFQDLAVLMTVAGLASVLFTRMGWPKVLGYLLAGVLVSSHTWGAPILMDEASISTIGQLGMVFLMFTLGLEFSASDMKKVRHVTIPTALFDVSMMIWLGYTVGRQIFGWGMLPSLFLGAAICDSATTLLAKALVEMKWMERPFVRYIFGTTICEDILCIGVIALITGVASGKGLSLLDVGLSLGGLAVFLVCVVVFGLSLVPRLLNQVARMKDDEALLLTLLGFCFFVSFVAARFDFSLALGAFLVGILGASSEVRARLHRLVGPLRDMFAAVFFVAIGLLVDPLVCWRNLPAILGLVVVIILGKGFNCFALSILTGQRIKDAVQTGFGLAQIGEFAYMVALLYLSMTNDASCAIYQIVVGASLITTCLNPVLLRLSDPVGDWMENHVPAFVRGWLAAYNVWLTRFRAATVPSALQRHIRGRLVWLAAIGALNLSVSVAASALNGLDYGRHSAFFEAHKRLFFCLLANVYFVSMLAPVAGLARSLGRDVGTVLVGTRQPRRWRAAVVGVTTFSVVAAVLLLMTAQVFMSNVHLLPEEVWLQWTVMALLLLATVLGWKRFAAAGRRAGHRFKGALLAEQRRSSAPAAITLAVPGDFYGRLVLPASSSAIGQTIRALDIRAKTGASIVSITREGSKTRNPGPDWRFAEADEIMAIGTPRQLASFRALLSPTPPTRPPEFRAMAAGNEDG